MSVCLHDMTTKVIVTDFRANTSRSNTWQWSLLVSVCVDTYRDCLHTLHRQSSSRRSKSEFCTKQSPWSFTTQYLTSWKSAVSVSPYHSRPVAFGSLSAFEQLQGPHHQRHIRFCPECGVAPHSIEHLFNCQSHPTQLTVGQPRCSRRLPQPGQLTIGEELLGYHNSNICLCGWYLLVSFILVAAIDRFLFPCSIHCRMSSKLPTATDVIPTTLYRTHNDNKQPANYLLIEYAINK